MTKAIAKTPSLYEISGAYLSALDNLTDPDVDMPLEAVVDTMAGIEGELSEKAVNVVQYMRNLEATAEAIKEAEGKMRERRKAIENRAARLKHYVHDAMVETGVTKIESPWFSLAIQKNPGSVETDADLSSDFSKTTVEMPSSLWAMVQDQVPVFSVKGEAPDKTAIKTAIKDGVSVRGARLVTGTRLAIRGA